MNQNKIPSVGSLVASLTAQAAIMLITPIIVAIDLMNRGGGIRETSLTEFTQEAAIIISAIIFAIGAYRRPYARGCLTLIAGFMGCIAIRELDMYFDLISHGFWLYPALLLAAACIAYAARCGRSALRPFLWYSREKFFSYLTVGFLILLFFSRLFGTGSLWELALPDRTYVVGVKSTVQEGLELLGYMLVLLGAVLFHLRKPLSDKQQTKRRRQGYI